jgi:hypothetical protein
MFQIVGRATKLILFTGMGTEKEIGSFTGKTLCESLSDAGGGAGNQDVFTS